MPFKKYKEQHGGVGPFQDLYSAATGGAGLFGRLGLRKERELTDQLIADISSQEEFAGLSGLAEAGHAPMTKPQHAEYRANLVQAAVNTRAFNAGMEDYVKRSAEARQQVVSKEDNLILDNLDAMAAHAQRLAASGNADKANEVFGTVFNNFGSYVSRNEEQRLELESSEAAGRETIRKEIQSEYNTKLLDPIRQDTANYLAIREQLEGAGEETAPPSLVSAVLEYAGASLRQSDDGNWSFAIGPLGISDTNLPAMTYSQIRNRLDRAYQGRDKYMRGEVQRLETEAAKRGFGINGTGVDDLLFPLANQIHREREAESVPQPPKPADVSRKAEQAVSTVGNVLEGVGRAITPDSITDALSYGLTSMFDPNNPKPEQQQPQRLPVNGDSFNGVPIDRGGTARGVYIPPWLRQRRAP